MKNNQRETGLTLLLAALTAIASLGGLLLPGLYRDNAFIIAVWKGNDIITLAAAVPLLLIASALSRRGSRKAELLE